jgi:hypothetical protein
LLKGGRRALVFTSRERSLAVRRGRHRRAAPADPEDAAGSSTASLRGHGAGAGGAPRARKSERSWVHGHADTLALLARLTEPG